nr:hypothetical protein CFP56_30154 [Quercus suber]
MCHRLPSKAQQSTYCFHEIHHMRVNIVHGERAYARNGRMWRVAIVFMSENYCAVIVGVPENPTGLPCRPAIGTYSYEHVNPSAKTYPSAPD